MHRRALLLAALGGWTVALPTDRLEAAVTSFLYYDILDDDLFPELKPGPGRKGIQARALAPLADKRVPAGPKAMPLLVVFRLDEPPLAALDPTQKPPGWQLAVDLMARDGSVQRHLVTVMKRPLEGNYSGRPIPDTSQPPVPGMVYRGAFWADLAGLYAEKLLRTGMSVELSFGQQAQVRVTLV